MLFIPEPIMYDILARLPVESLARFKCVNKHWHSLITDPNFVYSHLELAKKQNCIVLSSFARNNLHSIVHFYIVTEDGFAVLLHFAPMTRDSYHILPSCNGLICFYGASRQRVFICNPCTRKIVPLPDSTADASDFWLLSCGFGFDAVRKEYKVIKMMELRESFDHDHGHHASADKIQFQIFTLGSDRSWRRVKDRLPFRLQNRKPPVFANGAFHWMSSTAGSSGFVIVSFDVHSEKFRVIEPPEIFLRKNWQVSCLEELGGKLCYVDLDFEMEGKRRIDIWFCEDGDHHDHDQDHDTGDEIKGWKQECIIHPTEELDLTRPVAIHGQEVLLHGMIKGLTSLNGYNLKSRRFRPAADHFEGMACQYLAVSAHVRSLVPIIGI